MSAAIDAITPWRLEGEHFDILTTDAGNAERLVRRYRDSIRYVAGWRRWLIWDGTAWRLDDRRQICELAKEVTEDIIKVAALLPGERSTAFLKWG